MTPTRKKRGRISSAALAAPKVFGLEMSKLPPPVELDGEQKETWHLIVTSMPDDWFGAAAQPLLVQLCRHTVQARRIAELIEQAAGNPETQLGFYQNLLALQARESAAICALSGKLRLSPSALRDNRGHLQHKRPNYTPPWEWTPRDEPDDEPA